VRCRSTSLAVIAAASMGVLAGCGGGSGAATADDTSGASGATGGTAPAPVLTLAANPTQVASGATATLTWSSTNATSCTASGGWSGSMGLSGTQSVGPLTSDVSYDLVCSATGGTVEKSVTIKISATGATPPAPMVSLQASPTQVDAGSDVTLSWTSTNATSCTASGGWSGSQATSGTLAVGPLAVASVFMLSCSGSGGTAQATAQVDVPTTVQGQLTGSVDSNLIDPTGVPQVYVFRGSVTPHDKNGSASDPAYVADVVQDANACTFHYSLPTLAAGTYTVAFTSESQKDQASATDNIPFTGTTTVTVASSPVAQNFAATGHVLTVGPGKTYATIAAAAAKAVDGDVIQVDAGTYTDDVVVWRQNNIAVRGVGNGRAAVVGNRVISFVSGDDRNNGKALWVVEGSNVRVENIEFANAQVTDGNGAGIRNDGRNLTVCNGYFHDDQDGFLGDAIGTLTIQYSTFTRNGIGDGYTHNVYVNDGGSNGDKLVFEFNDSDNVKIGHTLKTRSRENYILYNRLVDETGGTSSYNIDVPNGGIAVVVGNVIQQGSNTDNPVMVAYGAEGLASDGRTHELYLANNTFVNDLGSNSVFVSTASGVSDFRSVNNLYVGGGTQFQGKQPTASTTDLATSSPGFVDRASFNYQLTSSSPAVNAGSSPGTGNGFSLIPQYEVVAGGRRMARPVVGTLDVGAYEYAP
jgi:hypothetical protein